MKRIAVLAVVLLAASSAQAQITFPRLGISASAESYVDTMTVGQGEEFTLYACAFGYEPGVPLNQDIAVLRWVVHQACCGASLVVQDVEFNPQFTHEGNPYAGVSSSSEVCVTQDVIWLATLTCVMEAPEPGNYLAAAGSFAPAEDCEGEYPLFMDMPMFIEVTGEPTPVEPTTWDGLKTLYR